MSANDKEVKVGQIVEAQPNNVYKIELPTGEIVKGYASGRLRQNRINILIGDKVKFEVDEYGTNNRIIRRL